MFLALAVAALGAGVARAAVAPTITIFSQFFPANGGIITQDFTTGQGTGLLDDAKAIAVQRDKGRILTVGQTANEAGIVAYKTNGALDTSFGPNDAAPVGGLADEGTYFVRRSCTPADAATKVTLHTTLALAQVPCSDPTQPAKINLTATGSQPVLHKFTSGSKVASFAPVSPTVDGTAETIRLPDDHDLQTGDEVTYDIGSWSDGRVAVNVPGKAQTLINSIVVMSDGRIRLAGAAGGSNVFDIALVGMTADGRFDPAFGPNSPIPPLAGGSTYYARPTLANPERVLLYPTPEAADADDDENGSIDLGDPTLGTGTQHKLTKVGDQSYEFNPFSGDVLPVSNSIDIGPNDFVADSAVNAAVVYDPGTGQSSGRVTFRAGSAIEAGARLVAGPGDRLAVTGTRTISGRDDIFVAMYENNGLPVTAFSDQDIETDPGVVGFNRGGTDPNNSNQNRHDRGIDVAFLPNGNPVAFGLVSTVSSGTDIWNPFLHAFNRTNGNADTGFSADGDLLLAGTAADPDAFPSGGLVSNGDRLWVTGAIKPAAFPNDVDAYLTRVNSAGGGVESRTFDMPGGFNYGTPLSRPRDLTITGGSEPTIVVAGSVGGNGVDWAAAGFRTLGGPVASMPFSSSAFPSQSKGEYPAIGVADGGGGAEAAWVAMAGNFDKSSSDKAAGTGRFFLDSGATCNLGLEVPTLELIFEGPRSASATVRVRNTGTKPCAGVVSLEAPYRMSPGSIATGEIPAGGTFTRNVQVSFSGTRRPEDVAVFTVKATGDTSAADDRFPVRAVFNYCDLSVRRESGVGYLPSEGLRRMSFNLRNAGTTACRGVKLGVSRGGRRVGGDGAATLRPGKSISSELGILPNAAGVRAGAAGIVVAGVAEGDVNGANNTAAFRPSILKVGDTNARRPRGRSFSGSATAGKGKARKSLLRVRRVDVAIMRRGSSCSWVTSKAAKLRKRSCSRPLWLRAKGTRRFRFSLTAGLPRGRYVLLTRAVIGAGFPEARFSARDRNEIAFTR